MANSFCFGQGFGGQPPIVEGPPCIVQLTEFRMKKSANIDLLSNEIEKSFDEMKVRGEIEIIETIQISVLPGFESMVQVGKLATVNVGVTSSPGKAPSRHTQQQSIGTLVRLTAEPRDGKTQLGLTYESSRFDRERTDDSPPDTNTFTVNTTMLISPSKTTLVGGSSAGSSTFLSVSVKQTKLTDKE
jgi:hypothetical protein